MSKTLEQIAQQLGTPQTKKVEAQKERVIENAVPKVQLIYAFNGTGKTRLSLALKKLISPKLQDVEDLFEVDDIFEVGETRKKFLYYNAFTEDLFYWDNDLEADTEPKLKIQPNSFTDWMLLNQGLDQRIIDNFRKFTGSKAEILFDPNGKHVRFIYIHKADIDDVETQVGQVVGRAEHIKISRGEESNFIWSVFYTFLDQIIDILNDPPEARETNLFDQLEYIFIDDPVSSLDDNHLIELAVDLAMLIKRSYFKDSKGLRFVITTHSPLFYNVLYNELLNNDLYKNDLDGTFSLTKGENDENCKRIYKRDQAKAYRLIKKEDSTFNLEASNDRPFSYHIFLLNELRVAIKNGTLEKYHFNFLRNILERTATFLGHKHWSSLIEKADPDLAHFANRILNLFSHSAHAGDEISDITANDKESIEKLVKALTETYGFYEAKEKQNAGTN